MGQRKGLYKTRVHKVTHKATKHHMKALGDLRKAIINSNNAKSTVPPSKVMPMINNIDSAHSDDFDTSVMVSSVCEMFH